jgi:site-specific recombinase XerD
MTPPPSNKGCKFHTEILTPEEIGLMMGAMLRTPWRPAPTNLRNQATLAIILGAGLRIAEALALKPHHIDVAQGSVHVLSGKGLKERIVAINGEALPFVVRWMTVRASLPGVKRTQPLLCTYHGGAMSPRYVRTMLNRARERAGIEKRVHPHGFRHMHAVMAERNGAQVTDIQEQLGHSSLQTTQVYLKVHSPTRRIRRMHEMDMDLGLEREEEK